MDGWGGLTNATRVARQQLDNVSNAIGIKDALRPARTTRGIGRRAASLAAAAGMLASLNAGFLRDGAAYAQTKPQAAPAVGQNTPYGYKIQYASADYFAPSSTDISGMKVTMSVSQVANQNTNNAVLFWIGGFMEVGLNKSPIFLQVGYIPNENTHLELNGLHPVANAFWQVWGSNGREMAYNTGSPIWLSSGRSTFMMELRNKTVTFYVNGKAFGNVKVPDTTFESDMTIDSEAHISEKNPEHLNFNVMFSNPSIQHISGGAWSQVPWLTTTASYTTYGAKGHDQNKKTPPGYIEISSLFPSNKSGTTIYGKPPVTETVSPKKQPKTTTIKKPTATVPGSLSIIGLEQPGKTITIMVGGLTKNGTWALYASDGTRLTPPSKLGSKGSGSITFTIEPGSQFLNAITGRLQVHAKDSKGLTTMDSTLNPNI